MTCHGQLVFGSGKDSAGYRQGGVSSCFLCRLLFSLTVSVSTNTQKEEQMMLMRLRATDFNFTCPYDLELCKNVCIL